MERKTKEMAEFIAKIREELVQQIETCEASAIFMKAMRSEIEVDEEDRAILDKYQCLTGVKNFSIMYNKTRASELFVSTPSEIYIAANSTSINTPIDVPHVVWAKASAYMKWRLSSYRKLRNYIRNLESALLSAGSVEALLKSEPDYANTPDII